MVQYQDDALIQWNRLPVTGTGINTQVTALRAGSVSQLPTSTTNDKLGWGYLYMVAETDAAGAGAAMVLELNNATRTSFIQSGTVPASDNPYSPLPLVVNGAVGPGTGPQVGIDRPGNDLPNMPFTLPKADYNLCWASCNTTAGCEAWAYGIVGAGCETEPLCWLKGTIPGTSPQSCRVSGQQFTPLGPGASIAAATVFNLGNVGAAPVSRFVVVAIDEIVSIDWFGELLPPYWRRNLPVNSTDAVPTDMLAAAFTEYDAVVQACDDFDATNAALLSEAGGDVYATIAQLTYRQVWGATTLPASRCRGCS